MENLVGKKFGKLTVLGLAKKTKNRSENWICRCDCGRTKKCSTINLVSGAIQDCGCSLKQTGIIGVGLEDLLRVKKSK